MVTRSTCAAAPAAGGEPSLAPRAPPPSSPPRLQTHPPIPTPCHSTAGQPRAGNGCRGTVASTPSRSRGVCWHPSRSCPPNAPQIGRRAQAARPPCRSAAGCPGEEQGHAEPEAACGTWRSREHVHHGHRWPRGPRGRIRVWWHPDTAMEGRGVAVTGTVTPARSLPLGRLTARSHPAEHRTGTARAEEGWGGSCAHQRAGSSTHGCSQAGT